MPSIVRTARALLFMGILLSAFACAGLIAPMTRPAPTPTPSAAATDTPLPLYQQVALSSVAGQEHGQPFDYSITYKTPILAGSDDPRVTRFNEEMHAVVSQQVATFKENLSRVPPTPISAASTFDVRFNLLSPPGDILSIKFDLDGYVTGAAHPYHTSQTVNYVLSAGQDLALSDLFLPNSNYLDVVSKYCIAQLGTRDIGFDGFELGATAASGNYRNWNITADGLMITFDEYQVAPYAAGPQTVLIPYKELRQILQPQGPLAMYIR